MAKQNNLDCVITLAGVDYSTQMSEATLARLFEVLNTTSFGDTAQRKEAGLSDGSFSLTMKPTADLTNFNTISNLGGTVFAVTFKSDSSAIAGGNPEFQFNVLMDQVPPWGGGVGTLLESSFSLSIDGAVTVDTTP